MQSCWLTQRCVTLYHILLTTAVINLLNRQTPRLAVFCTLTKTMKAHVETVKLRIASLVWM